MAADAVRPTPRRWWRELVVTLGAVAGLVCLVLAVIGPAFGIRPLIFTSGSMSPTIDTGALALARTTPATDLGAGDVVSVLDPHGERVTHRVVSATPAGDATSLVLKGDANESSDLRPYVVTEADRVLVDVPHAGRVVVWATGPVGVTVLGLLLALAVLAAWSPSQRQRHLRGSYGRTSRRGAVVSVLVVAASKASLHLAPTQAFWTDSADATSGTFATAAAVPAPTTPGCSEASPNLTGTWSSLGSRYRYQVTVNRADTGAQVGNPQFFTSTSATLNPTAFASTATYQATGEYNFTYRVSGAAGNSTTWLSSSSVAIPFHFAPAWADTDCGHDTSTAVAITSLGSDTGTAGDFATRTASNTVSGTSTPGDRSTIVIKRGGTQIATATANPTTGAWTSSSFTLTSGSQTLTAEATDYVGNTATDTQAVVLDTTTAVAITSLSSDTGDSSSDFKTKTASNTISGTSTPGDKATIVIKRGGTTLGTVSANVTTGAWSYSFTLAEGNQTMTAESTDYVGNTATDSQVVMLDTVAPALTVTTPTANGSNCSGKAGCGTASDALSGMSGGTAATSIDWLFVRRLTSGGAIQCRVGSSWTTCTAPYTYYSAVGTLPAFQSGAAYEKLSNYTYQASFTATDVVGNVVTVNSATW